MLIFTTASGKSIESKNQLLQIKSDEIAVLTAEQAKYFGVSAVRSIKENGTIRVGVLKEQVARMNAIEIKQAEQIESDRRDCVFAVASLHQNCFTGSDC